MASAPKTGITCNNIRASSFTSLAAQDPTVLSCLRRHVYAYELPKIHLLLSTSVNKGKKTEGPELLRAPAAAPTSTSHLDAHLVYVIACVRNRPANRPRFPARGFSCPSSGVPHLHVVQGLLLPSPSSGAPLVRVVHGHLPSVLCAACAPLPRGSSSRACGGT